MRVVSNSCLIAGPHVFTENETIAKYEIMDGAPVKGESIPIRVFLAGYDLTPTMRDINKKFSVRYFLNLVLMDTEDRRYFKQQEIILWRKSDKARKSLTTSQTSASASQVAGAPGTNRNLAAPSNLVGQDGNLIPKTDAEKAAMEAAHKQVTGAASNLSSPTGAFDPTVGLFTEESPQQGNNHPNCTTVPYITHTLSLAESNPVLQNSTSVEREAGDGAPNVSNGPEEDSPKLFNSTNVKSSPVMNTSHLNPDLETPPEDTEQTSGGTQTTKTEVIHSAPPLTLDSDPESQD